MSQPSLSAAERLAALKPAPPPVPAYLPKAGSPLVVDKDLYNTIASAPRVLTEEFTLPIRSGQAWTAKAGSIVRISTPEGPQVGKSPIPLTCTSSSSSRPWANPQRFWASRTRQLHSTHLTTYDRLWSTLPYMRPLLTIISDSLAWHGRDAHGGRVHDLLGTRCDPYINSVLTGGTDSYDFHCHSNLVRAVAPHGLQERDVHDVINLFQVTGLDEQGRYFMNPCPAEKGDSIEFLAEVDVLMAMSTCPGGDLSLWGFGADSEKEMIKCCRPLKVEVFKLEDEGLLDRQGWKPAEVSPYKGNHGMTVPQGEGLGPVSR
ncbi:meiotic chromosome segregation protein [Verticillium dahliae]